MANSTFDNSSSSLEEIYANITMNLDLCFQTLQIHRDFTQLKWVTVTIVVAYILVMVLALLGNLLVIWTVWRNSHMHTVTNYYLVNLAISDFLVAGIVMPLKLLEYTADCQWKVFQSDALCSVVYYLLPIFVFASVLTLVAISIERYYAIVHPLSAMKVNSKSRTRKIIFFTWLIPVIVALPYIYCESLSFTIESELGRISRQICSDKFDEIDKYLYGADVKPLGRFRKGYFLFLFCAIYLIPSAVIFTTCVKIAVSLLQPIAVENSPLGRKDTSRRHEENKRKVARMVIVIAIAFILSWSPQYIVSIVSQLQTQSFLREGNFIFTMLMTHFFGFVNCCLNPCIYTAMSERFRRSFKQIIRQIFCCCFSSRFIRYRQSFMGRSSNRYNSTIRQTMISDQDAQQMALNDSSGHSETSAPNKPCISPRSSVHDSEFKAFKKSSADKVIKKYSYSRNTNCNRDDGINKPLIDTSNLESPALAKSPLDGAVVTDSLLGQQEVSDFHSDCCTEESILSSLSPFLNGTVRHEDENLNDTVFNMETMKSEKQNEILIQTDKYQSRATYKP